MSASDKPAAGNGNEPEKAKANGDVVPAVGPTRTPMYQALNANRYQRQTLIKSINSKYRRKLISFVCGKGALIDRDDTLGFIELLHNVALNENLDLLLHTPGGDVDAAEKLINLVHTRVGDGTLRIIVPDFAKSAGTLMALGAHKILMSDSSELGPIDPQITLDDGRGNRINHSVLCFLDAYKVHSEGLKKDPDDAVAQMMLDKLDPATVRMFETVRDRARTFAEDQLRRWMFQKTTGNFSKIASDLMDTKRYPSHGQMIGWQEAQQLGLEVEYMDPRSEPWMQYWQLYCLQRLAVKDSEKLFESDYASLVF